MTRLCTAPADKDARLKLLECEKMVQKIEFLKAIEVGEAPSAAEGLNLDDISTLILMLLKARFALMS